MSSGHWHTCIASNTNEIYCWGDGASGKQGDGSTNNNQVPGKTSYFSGTNPVKAHGEITSWEIHPALPTGLSFGSTNGTLYGTPTASLAQTNFTVYANNSGGSSTFILNLGVGPAPPGPFVYNPENNSITNNSLTQIAPSFVNGTNTGGAVTSWAINNTSLPTGLTFSTSNGTIYGTPTQLWNRTAYKVWANNSGGSVVAYFNLTVNDQIPTLSYSPDDLTLTKNQTSSDLPLNATLTGSGAITSWAISPALPSGLSFGTSNGTIWGTPTSLMTLKTFTIWANNSGGSVNATVNITVNDEAPDISYNPDWFVLTNNTAMSPPATPTNSGGAVPSTVIDSTGQVGYYTSIAIDSNGYKHISYYDSTNGDLKYATDKTGSWVDISVDTTGIVGIWTSIAIDSNDAVHISYYDTTNGGLKYATCSSGCTTASNWDNVSVDTTGDVGRYSSIAIDSNDAVHISYLDYTNRDLKYIVLDSSSNIYGYSVSPDLPAGLSLNAFTGEISGTPTELSTNTTYTITVRNSGGVNTTTITIEVLDQLPGLSYSPENLTLTINNQSSDLPLNATVTGSGAITSWAISPALPSGLSFGTSNGTIWGTPTSLMTLKTFTIWANNSGGSVNATVNITVNA
ncbi:MAG: putative Ig domain-containing protein, partial [Candidatus Thalassarchaeum sp.]|nr:putative Ig domain-containing protein [Candidatus Thalassarchaeum sp.]